MNPAVELIGIKKHFFDIEGNYVDVVKDITLSIENNTFVSIIGPSGCGKSTMFNMIAGLMEPNQGEVKVFGERIRKPTAQIGYMMQKDLLFPWRSILDNVTLGLEVKGYSKKDRYDISKDFLVKYGLEEFANSYPSMLSGGMRQRVALIRTLVADPKIVLLDEPFSALDYQTRLVLEEEVVNILADYGKTGILITHDIGEAISMSDRIAVMAKRPTYVKKIYEVGLAKKLGSSMKVRADTQYNDFFENIWSDLDIQIRREA